MTDTKDGGPKVWYVGICDTTRAWHISNEMRTGADHIFVDKSAYDALVKENERLTSILVNQTLTFQQARELKAELAALKAEVKLEKSRVKEILKSSGDRIERTENDCREQVAKLQLLVISYRAILSKIVVCVDDRQKIQWHEWDAWLDSEIQEARTALATECVCGEINARNCPVHQATEKPE